MAKVVENYVIKEILGSGSYGDVHLAQHIKNKKKVAIKIVHKRTFKKHHPMLEKLTRNEITTLRKIKHKNIINFIEIMRSSNNTYYVYEYCNGGNLFDLLRKHKRFSEK